MPTSKETQNLIDLVQSMKGEVSTLKTRISTLVDELHVTKTELSVFKSNVAKDVTYLTERIDGGHF
tara:strand:- start:105 stop:302 length:198 start_codon:yes stop_codon:yes gene_type:complete